MKHFFPGIVNHSMRMKDILIISKSFRLKLYYLDMTYDSFVKFGLNGVFASRDHFFSLLSLLMRNIPAPCDLPHGFMIQVLCGDLRYSSTNIL